MKYFTKIIIFLFLAPFLTTNNVLAKNKVGSNECLKIIEKSLEINKERFKEYTTYLVKQEAFDGKLRKPEKILLKYKNGNIYMKWEKGPFKGQEAIFNTKREDGKIKAHKGGFLGAISLYLDPRSKMATKGQHHPITDAGLEKLCNILKTALKNGIKNNEIDITDHGYVKEKGKELRKIEVTFPKDCPGIDYTAEKDEDLWTIADKFQTDMYVVMTCNKKIGSPWDVDKGDKVFIPNNPSYRTIIYCDEETYIPVKLEIFDWNNKPYEVVEYRDINFKPGLKEIDFSEENPKYRF